MGYKKGTRNFILHGGILAMAGILVRVIGLIYRIPMVRIISPEGLGLYSVAFNIYNTVLILSSYGLPMAVSKLISTRLSVKEYKNAHKVFIASIIVSLVTGGISAFLLFFGADFIERTFYANNVGVAVPLRILAPTIFIVAVLGVFRGFYQGQGTMIPTAVSQLAEQIVNAFVSIFAAYMLVKMFRGTADAASYGAAGGTLGTAFGALTALVILFLIYLMYRPIFVKKVISDTGHEEESYKEIYKVIGMTMIPIILGQTFYNISAVLDDIMYSNLVTVGPDIINSSIGLYNSSYMLLISLPMGVASAMSASMLPSIVKSKTQGFVSEINSKIHASVKTNMFIAIPSFIGLVVLGEPIIQLLFGYSGNDSYMGAMMLKMGAVAVIFFTLSTVTSSALQGIDKMNLPVIHSCIALVIHIVFVWCLLKYTEMDIYSIVIGSMTFPILIAALNLASLHQYLQYKQEVVKTFGIPLAFSMIMGMVCGIVYKIFMNFLHVNMIALIFALISAGVVYLLPIFLLKKRGIY